MMFGEFRTAYAMLRNTFVYLNNGHNCPNKEIVRNQIILRKGISKWRVTLYLPKEIEEYDKEFRLVVFEDRDLSESGEKKRKATLARFRVSEQYAPYEVNSRKFLEKVPKANYYRFSTLMTPTKSRLRGKVFSLGLVSVERKGLTEKETIEKTFFPFESYRLAVPESRCGDQSYHTFLSFIVNYDNALLWWNILDSKRENLAWHLCVISPRIRRNTPIETTYKDKSENTWYGYYYYCNRAITGVSWTENLPQVFGEKDVVPKKTFWQILEDVEYVCNLYQVGEREIEKVLSELQ